jgi:hypothetical protein
MNKLPKQITMYIAVHAAVLVIVVAYKEIRRKHPGSANLSGPRVPSRR